MSRVLARKLSSLASRGGAAPRERIFANLEKLAELQGRSEQLKADLASLGLKAAEKQPAAAAGYTRDTTLWHNKPFWNRVEQEATRTDFWPFLVSAAVVYLALGVWLPLSLPESGKKTSDYWKLLTGDAGHGHGHEGHH